MIRDCTIDPTRFAVIAECTETYGMEYRAPENEWVWNVISRKTVVYSCGAIGRAGETLEHNHSPIEEERCQRLSQQAADIMAGHLMGCDANEHRFIPFYVLSNDGDTVPDCITETVVRSAFGGTIYPAAKVVIQPLESDESWWIEATESFEEPTDPREEYWTEALEPEELEDDYEDEEEKAYRTRVEAWARLILWFKNQPELHHPVFVSISVDEPYQSARTDGEPYNGACVFPRLAIALTQAGSLAGVFTCAVHA
jgi:hypothetical protein